MALVKEGSVADVWHVLKGISIIVDFWEKSGRDDVSTEVGRIEGNKEEGAKTPEASNQLSLRNSKVVKLYYLLYINNKIDGDNLRISEHSELRGGSSEIHLH